MKTLIFLIALLSLATSDKCGGNCPSDTCPYCICGTKPIYPDVNYWCSKYTWNQNCCRCIVEKESSGNKNAMNFNVDDSFDAGLWQVNSFNWPYCGITEDNVSNLQKNLDCAIQVYKWGSNTWKFWTTAHLCGCENSS